MVEKGGADSGFDMRSRVSVQNGFLEDVVEDVDIRGAQPR